MARFDVYEVKSKPPVPYLLLDVQAEAFERIATRIVIPLMPDKHFTREYSQKLTPTFTIGKRKYTLKTPEMGSMETGFLGKVVANLESEHYKIIDAIDFLLQGF